MALRDFFQTEHTILRNFPVLGHMRYLAETVRPGVQQYFIENESEGRPFSKEERSLVYQRAKGVLDTKPFGTQRDVYEVGYEWVNHSMAPVHVDPAGLRVTIGGPDCTQPYDASILNISAMSYGSLSKNAVLALNGGAKDGNFAHNTGEGGVSPHHKENGGDLIWQIGIVGPSVAVAEEADLLQSDAPDRGQQPLIPIESQSAAVGPVRIVGHLFIREIDQDGEGFVVRSGLEDPVDKIDEFIR